MTRQDVDHHADWCRETPDERVAERRAQYLRRVTPWDGDDGRPIAVALAYRRLGYSHRGIAGRLDTTEATVAAYMDEVRDVYGSPAVETAHPNELAAWPDAAFPFEKTNTRADGGYSRPNSRSDGEKNGIPSTSTWFFDVNADVVGGLGDSLPGPAKRWVVWTAEQRNGRWTKPPRQPERPTRNARSNDNATLADCDTALSVAERRERFG